MPWQQLILQLEAGEVPRAEALLRLAGAEALSVHGEGEEELLEPAPGTTPMWGRVSLQALFAASTDTQALAGMLASALGSGSHIVTRALPEEEWSPALKPPTFVPQRIGRLVLMPGGDATAQGEQTAHSPPREPDEAPTCTLRLNMGLAFGTGKHPTTRLCLEWLETHLPPGARVLDYGAGSGVLALAALVLGAEYAWAVDNDPQALSASRDNAHLNGLDDSVWVGTPEAFDATAAAGAGGADVLVANILAGPLQHLAEAFCRYVRPGGAIVLSGVLVSQCDAVEAAFRPCFGRLERSLHDDWVRLDGYRLSDP